MSGYSGDEAAPERVRWPRLTAIPDPRLQPLLSRGYVGFTEATSPRHLVLPATTAVPLVVKLAGSPYRPRRSSWAATTPRSSCRATAPPRTWRCCCPPWAPTASSGCPWTSSAATPSTWPRCWGPAGGASASWPARSAGATGT